MPHRRRIGRLLPSALSVLLCGCPLETPVPLTPSEGAELDPSILGRWQCRFEGEEKPTRFAIQAFDSRQYVVVPVVDPDEEMEVLRAFVSCLPRGPVLNVQSIKADGVKAGEFSFLRYRLDGGRLELHTVDAPLFKGIDGTDAAALRAVVEKHWDDPALFDSEPLRCDPDPPTEPEE